MRSQRSPSVPALQEIDLQSWYIFENFGYLLSCGCFYACIHTHTEKNAHRYDDVTGEVTLITILMEKLWAEWLLNRMSSALRSGYSTVICEKGHFYLHPYCKMEDNYCRFVQSARDGFPMSGAALWAQTVLLRSNSAAFSSFPSGSSLLHGSSHLLTPSIKKKNEKTMHEFERESHLLCWLLVRQWAGQGQWEPNSGPSLWNWWCGKWFLSRQLWRDTCQGDTRDFPLSVQVYLGWRKHLATGFVSIGCSELTFISAVVHLM